MTLKKYQKTFISFILLLVIFSLAISPVLAQKTLKDAKTDLGTFADKAGFDKAGVEGGTKDIDYIIGSIIKYFLSFLGVVFLVLLIYGGFMWMQAKGDSEEVTKAKDTMYNAIIGLAIVLGAYLITFWIVDSLTSTTLQ